MADIVDFNKAIDEIKLKVTIPKYFEEIIVPELEYYYSLYGADFNVKPVALCPLHDEDTPSFRYYDETNTFYCFGCRAGGDIINLHRRFTRQRTGEDVTFIDAVKFLYDYFLKGIESTELPSKSKSKNEEEESISTIPEMLVYSNYIEGLENKLIRDSSINIENRIYLYNLIDKLNILTSVNMVNAMDAVRFLKNIEKNVGGVRNGD